MPVFSKNLGARISLALLVYAVVSGLALAIVLSTKLGALATDQQGALGHALGVQLAESLKQPVIDGNVISIQVILDNLLNDTESVVRATVYSSSNRILAQSQRSVPANNRLSAYTSPISVDNTMMGQVRVELNKQWMLSLYRTPIWIALGAWLVMTAVFAFWLISTAVAYSRRIQHINGSFPSDNNDHHQSELDTLEQTLEPFIQKTSGDNFDREYRYSMLAISIPNLPKWRAQLNADAFSQMLEKIDHLIDSHLRLFKGVRLQSRSGAMLLQFDDEGDEHPITRAIHCANALLKLCEQVATAEHLPFEVRITAAYREPSVYGSPWRNDLEREECINRLIDMLPLAGSWELIIDKSSLSEDQLQGCTIEEFSAASVWQFRSYSDEHQQIFAKQVAFLSSTLS
jgi:hypothetical protein